MTARGFGQAGAVLLAALVPAAAIAAPPTLYDIDKLPFAIECRDDCAFKPATERASCLAACDYPVDPAWEKSGRAPVDYIDYQLAVLEYWDGGLGTRMCYRGGVVLTAPVCAGPDCVANPTAAGCANTDGDALYAWQETLNGSSDDPLQRDLQVACTADTSCGFDGQCEFVYDVAQTLCKPRQCTGACTAFHLQSVAANANELIATVYFDYSPVPANVLDLRVLYTSTDLVLLDARALSPLTNAGKQLATTHPASGVVRLVVYGTGSLEPVPNGAIVELVFQRISSLQTSLGFETADFYQRNAMAPSQGAAQTALGDDRLWGGPITLPAAGTGASGLVLAYAFDSLTKPLEYSKIPTAEKLCELMGPTACPTQDDAELRRTRTLSALRLLQAGKMTASSLMPGVVGNAAYFDGAWDHLELPVTLNEKRTASAPETPLFIASAQDASLSMWFLPEGRSADETSTDQVLWSHLRVSNDESTRYGVLVSAGSAQAADLVWFDDGSPSGTPRTTIAAGIPLHKWAHLGMTFDAAAGSAQFYLDGVAVKRVDVRQPAVSCPALGDTVELQPAIRLQREGEGTSAAQEVIYVGRPLNGLVGIDRMDEFGYDVAPVLHEGTITFQDPDYSPDVDRVVFSSNESGSFEIWVADGTGANRDQLTYGFGDANRGIVARRPRWAPGAAGIVFESNVYDVSQGDNPRRVFHLYRIGYTPGSKTPFTAIDYRAIVKTTDQMPSYRLTGGTPARHHFGAEWIAAGANGTLGTLVYNSADSFYAAIEVHSLTLPADLSTASPTDLPLAMGRAGDDVEFSARLLAANYRVDSTGDKTKLLVATEKTTMAANSRFSVTSAVDSLGTTVTVTHTPPTGCTGACLPTDIANLYIAYNHRAGRFDLAASGAGAGIVAPGKKLELSEIGISSAIETHRYVRLEVTTSNADVIPSGAQVAVLRFATVDQTLPLALVVLEKHDSNQVFVKEHGLDNTPLLPLSPGIGLLQSVEQAAFAPDGDRVLLAGMSGSRPTLLRATITPPSDATLPGALYVLDNEEIVALAPTRIEGLSWAKVGRFMPCNRMASRRSPTLRQYQLGFRGAIDELKVYNYMREAGGFLSDAARGHEWLRAAGRDGVLAPILPTCTGFDTECPPFTVCDTTTTPGQCKMLSCTTAGKPDPAKCAGHGLCTWRPAPVEQENPGFQWVCTSECTSDSQCFQRDCLNGPCRFCRDRVCTECNYVEKDYVSFKVRELVGCPDANSFMCSDGNCVTECYSFENGQSKYLCNPTAEYCSRGRCEPLAWDWTDVSPASLSGLGEMQMTTETYTTALQQWYPIEIKAYGVEDYARAPELLVEGIVEGSQQGFLASWFPIGRVLVYNRSANLERHAVYRLATPYRVTGLRVRLVTPPTLNLTNSSTGFGFPGDAINVAQGSRFKLGYEMSIPEWQVRAACDAAGKPQNCAGLAGDSATMWRYLRGGEPAVVVTEVRFNGTEVLQQFGTNGICSYEGGPQPSELNAAPSKVYYGDIAGESSPEKAAFCHTHSCSPSTVLPFSIANGGALLNCNYFDPAHPNPPTAQGAVGSADLAISGLIPPDPYAVIGGIIKELPGNCLYEEQTPNGVTYKPCFEFADGDASVDPMSAGKQSFGSHGLLDIDLFRFFAWDGSGW